MNSIAILILLLAGVGAAAQSKPDENAIRTILDDEITAWNQSDASGYTKHFAADGTFTNGMEMFFTGQQAYRDRHEIIFKGRSRGREFGAALLVISTAMATYFWRRRDEVEGGSCETACRYRRHIT
jgi:ketosteroid isomerase-like protein